MQIQTTLRLISVWIRLILRRGWKVAKWLCCLDKMRFYEYGVFLILVGFPFVTRYLSWLQGQIRALLPYLTFHLLCQRLLCGRVVLMSFSIQKIIKMIMTGMLYLLIAIIHILFIIFISTVCLLEQWLMEVLLFWPGKQL